MGFDGRSYSSSGEEDGDADWKAAIKSVANTSTLSNNNNTNDVVNSDDISSRQPQKPKHYQIKAQKLLDEILEKTLETVKNPIQVPDEDNMETGGGIRLFRRAPPGVVFDHIDELRGPKKRPQIIPGDKIDEKSKKFIKKLESVAIDGTSIIAGAEYAYKKSLARLEAKDARLKEAAQRDEERVAELKRIRGEKWLPSIAREMRFSKLK